MYLAKELAALLERDPIAAGQIREHLTEERLCELLQITPMLVEREVERYVDLEYYSDEELLTELVRRRLPTSKVLSFINAAA